MVRPGIEVFTPRDRAAWLKARGQDVTASVIGALFGVHEFITPYELWARKTGRLPPDDENIAMRRGRLLEPVAVQMLREDRPAWQIEYSTEAQTYFRDPAHRIGATPDVIAICPQRGKGIVQIKSVDGSVFRRKWHPDGMEGATEPPFWIVLQAVLEAWLVGADWAAIAPLVIGHGIDLPLIDVPLDHMDDVVAAMQERTAEFWAMVAEDREPQPDYDRDAGLIDRLFSWGDDREEVDLTGDPHWLGVIATIRDAQGGIASLEAEKSAAEAKIKAAMGRAEIAHVPGGRRITWKTHRKINPGGIPSHYRVLRLPKD